MLNNNIGSFDSVQINTESRKNMLKSFQMMLEIEDRAQKKFTQILSIGHRLRCKTSFLTVKLY